MSKKKIFLWVGGVVVALLLIVGIAIAGNAIHKSHEANDAKDAYSDSYNKADKGKYDSTQKLKDKADQIEKSGSKADKKALKDAREGKVSQDEKGGGKGKGKDDDHSLLSKAFPNKKEVYGKYNGINRASLDDVKDFMDGKDGTKGQYQRVLNNYSTGSINMPSIGTKLPIVEGTSNQHLLSGATTFRPGQSITHGNYVLLGHNVGYQGMLFSSVPQLKKGDKITVNSYAHGKMMQQKYKVTEKKTIQASHGQVLDDTNERKLTLITCDVPRQTPNRVIVTAKPV